MMKIIFTIAAFIFLGCPDAFSQGDSTRYINGMPVSDDDTTRQFPPRDLSPENQLRPVGITQLPDEIREALEEGSQYNGWQDTTIYFQQNTQLYLVPIRSGGAVKIFGLNEDGEAVTYDEVEP